jgi:AhpD family alkylhydroperoxidase
MAIRYLERRSASPADPLVAAVHAQVRRDFGAAALEPFVVHAPSPPLLAAAWACLREGVLCGQVPRPVKETVAATISRENRCSYCVDAHTGLLSAADPAGGARAAWALRREGWPAIADPALRAAAAWAAATRNPASPLVATPPFGPAEAPEMIATAACFHYINRLATIFLGETPFPTRARLFEVPFVLVTALRFAPKVRRRLAPGASLRFLTPAELPADLAWARPRPEIAAPFASLAAAVEAETREVLGGGAAKAVRERIAAWTGEDPPLGSAWIDEVVTAVPERQRAATRLALLTALAPYRVGPDEVAAFRAAWPGDRALVAVTTWASFTAARRIAGWLHGFLL